jgi:hypothetical protein
MSFLISALLEKKALIASDQMIVWPDGRHEIVRGIKFGTLPFGKLILGWSGNSVVSWKMVQLFGRLIENDIENFSGFEKRLSTFKESFDPIYGEIPKENLQPSQGSGQLQGIGLVEGRLVVMSVNYVPSQADFKVMVTKNPGTVILSSVDDNVQVLGYLSEAIPKILDSGGLSDRRTRKIFKGIYRQLSRFDSSISASGHLTILKSSGEEKDFIF